METSRPAAERIRPILQAMERSIDSARRQRLHTPGTPVQPVAAATTQAIFPRPVAVAPQLNPEAGGAPRLKARPKRAENFASPYDQPVYRSQTG